MTTDTILTAVAEEYADFTLEATTEEEPVDPYVSYCPSAQAFHQWATDLLEHYVRGKTDEMRLAQAKVLLVDRYLDYRAYAPKNHRDKIGEKGHICLYQVFVTTMHEIRTRQLALDPPKVLRVTVKAEKPAESPIGNYPVLFLGEAKG